MVFNYLPYKNSLEKFFCLSGFLHCIHIIWRPELRSRNNPTWPKVFCTTVHQTMPILMLSVPMIQTCFDIRMLQMLTNYLLNHRLISMFARRAVVKRQHVWNPMPEQSMPAQTSPGKTKTAYPVEQKRENANNYQPCGVPWFVRLTCQWCNQHDPHESAFWCYSPATCQSTNRHNYIININIITHYTNNKLSVDNRIAIPQCKIHGCDWSKSRHVTFSNTH